MIHERLQSLDIKITELAKYLQISRPTMYKFIEAYDSGDRKSVNGNVLKLFDYIAEHELADKRNVIAFILSNLSNQKPTGTPEEQELAREIRQFLAKNPDSEKSAFIKTCMRKSSFDLIIHYLTEIGPLLSKNNLTQEEQNLLKPYNEIIGIYTKE